MRDILFRGKRRDNGEWVMSANIIRFNPEDGEVPIFIPGINEGCTCLHDADDNIISWLNVMFYKVYPETVGQFTGLTDKNGKKIFEGDILYSIYSKRNYVVGFGEYIYVDERGEYESACGWYTEEHGGYKTALGENTEDWAVKVGNIHDNPELLERRSDETD